MIVLTKIREFVMRIVRDTNQDFTAKGFQARYVFSYPPDEDD